MMQIKKFVTIGCGFWSRFQLAGWQELEGVECRALCDKDEEKAKALAEERGVAAYYEDAEEMVNKEQPDFIDIISSPETHRRFVELAAKCKIPVICQKPMSPSLEESRAMVKVCNDAGVPFFIHENFRWQTPLRTLKQEFEKGIIGKPFKARITYCSSFPVFKNQPFLAKLEQFLLSDVGTHILDVARSLFGEAESVYCQTASASPGIKGEDVATVFMKMKTGLQCYAEMSYASVLEHERFPETYVLIEGEKGSLELGPDFWIHTTTKSGTEKKRIAPREYSWADPEYALIHSSIVETNKNLLEGLNGKNACETTGEDNLKTLELVYSSYKSAEKNKVINLNME